jgi:hypothetical protein
MKVLSEYNQEKANLGWGHEKRTSQETGTYMKS